MSPKRTTGLDRGPNEAEAGKHTGEQAILQRSYHADGSVGDG